MAIPASDIQNEIAYAMDTLQKLYPDTFDTKKYLYLPHGKYAFAAEYTFQGRSRKEIRFHSTHEHYTVYARAGVIAGHKVTCLWKTWDVSKAWREFFQELYFYSHPKLLRWLQGIVVPRVIGIHHEPNGQKSILMEAPHHIHWHAANPELPVGEKEGIIRAYECLHAHGILHNSISFHNIFIDQDMNVTLVNFQAACCLDSMGIYEVHWCDQEALKREMRQIRYLIDYMGARIMERELFAAPQASASHGGHQLEPLSAWDMDLWDQLASHCEDTYTIPSDMRNRPLPNDGRKKPKGLKKASQKVKAAVGQMDAPSILSTNQVASTSGEFTQDAANSGPHNESPNFLQPSSSAITPPLYSLADVIDRVPLSPHLDAPPSTSFEEDTSEMDTGAESDSEVSRAFCSGQHNILDWSSACRPISSLLLPSRSLPPISDFPVQPTHALQSSLPLAHGAPIPSNLSYPDCPPSPKVFYNLTHEQLRLAIKQHDAAVDAKLALQPAINTDKSMVVFHPDTNDNGTYTTGSDPFRKRKKKRRPTPFFLQGYSSAEDETNSDEGDEDEEPEPEIDVDFEDLIEHAQYAKLRGRRRISRPGILSSMVSTKYAVPELEVKSQAVAQPTSSKLASPALSSISEEESPHDASGTPPYTVVFVGANGSPDEVWQLPVSAHMYVKSLAARQPQAKKLRVEQIPRIQGPPHKNTSLPSLTQRTHNRTSKKRKIACVADIEYFEQKTSKRTRKDHSTPSSCIIC